MKHEAISKVFKLIVIVVALFGLGLYFFAIPELGKRMVKAYPEFANCYYPWLILLWVSGIPCYFVLGIVWKIAENFKDDRIFIEENAKYFDLITKWTLLDCIFFIGGGVILTLMNMNHPSILIGMCVIDVVGLAFAFCTRVLSELISKAAQLQQDSDLTI